MVKEKCAALEDGLSEISASIRLIAEQLLLVNNHETELVLLKALQNAVIAFTIVNQKYKEYDCGK